MFLTTCILYEFKQSELKLVVRSFRTLWATCIVAGEDPERLVKENRGFRC